MAGLPLGLAQVGRGIGALLVIFYRVDELPELLLFSQKQVVGLILGELLVGR